MFLFWFASNLHQCIRPLNAFRQLTNHKLDQLSLDNKKTLNIVDKFISVSLPKLFNLYLIIFWINFIMCSSFKRLYHRLLLVFLRHLCLWSKHETDSSYFWKCWMLSIIVYNLLEINDLPDILGVLLVEGIGIVTPTHCGRFWQKLVPPCFLPQNLYSNLVEPSWA